VGEGGGQIVRLGVALSAIVGTPITIYNIRSKRSPPGLRQQHLTAVRAVAQMADAEVKGLFIGSSRLEFSRGFLKVERSFLMPEQPPAPPLFFKV